MAKMTVPAFVDKLVACVDKVGKPDKIKMLATIGLHAVFYVKNFSQIEMEVNRRFELERLAIIDDVKIVDNGST